MLQLSVIRQNPELVKERLALKNFNDLSIVDQLLNIDDEKRKLQTESENIQSKANAISKEIGQLMTNGQKDEAAAKKKEVESINASVKPIKEKINRP